MRRTKWKSLFFILLAGNIVVALFFFILMSWPIKEKPVPYSLSEHDKKIEFEVNTTREDLTEYINLYLERKGLTKAYHYEVYLTDTVELYGKIPFFNRELDFKLSFIPSTRENGDLILKQESISIGSISLPVSYVMSFIEGQYSTPDWVTIQPDEESIYVSLHEIQWENNIQVKAKHFDLRKNHISFIVMVSK